MLQNLQAQSSDAADLARRWLSLSWLAVVVGSIYILAACNAIASPAMKVSPAACDSTPPIPGILQHPSNPGNINAAKAAPQSLQL